MFPNRTVAVDMRGYGDSDKPGAVEDYKMPRLVNDIKEIIEALGTCVASGRVRAKTFGLLQRKTDRSCKMLFCTLFMFCYLYTLVLIFMWRHVVGLLIITV
jgi:hypothetical protein